MIVFVALVIATATGRVEATSCEAAAAAAALEDGGTVVETSLKLLTGTWISEGCETRPGPEYVIRSYSFSDDGRYLLTQHHYWDDSCSSPQLTITSHGKIQMKSSLVQPGAAAGVFRVTNITVIPQDENAARRLDRTVSVECPGQYWKSWRKYEEHTVYDNRYDEKKKTFNLWMSSYNANSHHSINSKGSNVHFSDISCLGSLKWAFNELKLLKVQLRPLPDQAKKRPKEVKMELLLGDIHSSYKLRQYYNPTSFQVPLVKQVKEPSTIFVNRHSYLVRNTQAIPVNMFSNSMTPPHLIEKPHLPPYIWGDWTSTRCESRPMNLYLTRRFSFYSEDDTWIGEHKFYSDPFCKIPKFTVTAAGHYKLVGGNREIKGTSDIDFHRERASLTVLDQRMIDEMRLPELCGDDEWQVDVPKEMASNGGCIQLGMMLPSTQRDIVKLEMDYRGAWLLYLGQVDTDNLQSAQEEHQRPSAFQLPLVKCGETPGFSLGLREILSDAVNFNTGGDRKVTPVWTVAVIVILYFR
ncbi:protein APCDD1-like [Cylas formicarius]|uniref:protein APCDD1-like n=1 Tax=Cylas formicarius TaxID=197179 RepID=UPI002958D2C9|nr:protein APCDD1-like [Cylas formicarius]